MHNYSLLSILATNASSHLCILKYVCNQQDDPAWKNGFIFLDFNFCESIVASLTNIYGAINKEANLKIANILYSKGDISNNINGCILCT